MAWCVPAGSHGPGARDTFLLGSVEHALCQSHGDLNLREINHEGDVYQTLLRLRLPALRRLRLIRWATLLKLDPLLFT